MGYYLRNKEGSPGKVAHNLEQVGKSFRSSRLELFYCGRQGLFSLLKPLLLLGGKALQIVGGKELSHQRVNLRILRFRQEAAVFL